MTWNNRRMITETRPNDVLAVVEAVPSSLVPDSFEFKQKIRFFFFNPRTGCPHMQRTCAAKLSAVYCQTDSSLPLWTNSSVMRSSLSSTELTRSISRQFDPPSMSPQLVSTPSKCIDQT